MYFETIQKSSAPEMVVRQILESFRTGQLKRGDKLPSERELSKMFGVGRSSVREATKALLVMGYLEVFQGKGTFIRKNPDALDDSANRLKVSIEQGNIEHLLEVRELLECKSTKLAAKRAGIDQISKIQNAALRYRLSEENIKEAKMADEDFHVAIAEASGNPIICEIMKILTEHAKVRRAESIAAMESIQDQSYDTMEKIISAIIKKDGDTAARAMKKHLGIIKKKLKENKKKS